MVFPCYSHWHRGAQAKSCRGQRALISFTLLSVMVSRSCWIHPSLPSQHLKHTMSTSTVCHVNIWSIPCQHLQRAKSTSEAYHVNIWSSSSLPQISYSGSIALTHHRHIASQTDDTFTCWYLPQSISALLNWKLNGENMMSFTMKVIFVQTLCWSIQQMRSLHSG